ncbi:MAG: hypothetical protein IMW98_08020 [Firmicutes bacterium]|nr:hypothetical protein [Bacillota bacterium]
MDDRPRKYRWKGWEAESERAAEAVRLRVRNPLRRSPRTRPRDPDALRALVQATIHRIRSDDRFEQVGPRRWRMK